VIVTDLADAELIDGYLEHLRRAGRTAETRRGRGEVLRRLNRQLPYGLGQTTDEELAAWLYRDEWSQNTRYTYYMALRGFYRWATRPADPWLDFDPTETLEPVSPSKGRARPVTDAELFMIVTQAALPYRLWATIAAYQGLR
jgi:integrase